MFSLSKFIIVAALAAQAALGDTQSRSVHLIREVSETERIEVGRCLDGQPNLDSISRVCDDAGFNDNESEVLCRFSLPSGQLEKKKLSRKTKHFKKICTQGGGTFFRPNKRVRNMPMDVVILNSRHDASKVLARCNDVDPGLTFPYFGIPTLGYCDQLVHISNVTSVCTPTSQDAIKRFDHGCHLVHKVQKKGNIYK